jgi:hypothetical protein
MFPVATETVRLPPTVEAERLMLDAAFVTVASLVVFVAFVVKARESLTDGA